jgi:CRISPR-associated protein Csb1
VTSEIIGYDVLEGVRPASRIDVHHVSSEVALAETGATERARFTVLEAGEKGKGAKRPSEFGYGNVTPSAASHGGVTIRFAEQQTVVSLAALRAVRTAELGDEVPSSPESDLAARELLALLALAMLEARVETGWDLRSGCQLIPEAEPTVELLGRLGTAIASVPIVGLGAAEVLAERARTAAEVGVVWDLPPIELVASPEQLELLRRSIGRTVDESSEG